MMKKLLLILLSLPSITAFSQQTVALLEPRVADGSTSVTTVEKNMVRGELRKAIVKLVGFEAVTRTDIDQMMKEQNFQRTGLVSDAQIKKLGEMSGADYICVSTLTKSNTEFYLEAYLIHLESGRMFNPSSVYGELYEGKLSNMYFACRTLANELLGNDSNVSSIGYSSKSQNSSQLERNIASMLQHPEEVQLYSVNSSWIRSYTGMEGCATNMSLTHEAVKNKMFDDAYQFWKEMYYNCPNYNKAIYSDGERILQSFLENATLESEREKYLNLLKETYDKRIFFFGKDPQYPKPYILGKKGVSLYTYSSKTEDKALSYFLLKYAMEGMREASTVTALATFYNASVWMYKNCPQYEKNFDSDFQIVRTYLRKRMNGSSIAAKALQKIEADYSKLRNIYIGSTVSLEDDEDKQTIVEEEEEEVVFVVVESMPEFPCGQDSLFRYLSANVKYPVIAQENGIQGRVVCQFVVNKDGSIEDVEVVRSGGDKSLDMEAVRVIQAMPKWTPGRQRGKAVRVRYTIPINFRLTSNNDTKKKQ